MVGKQLCDPNDISDWFWDIVQRAVKNRVKLDEILRGLPIRDVRRFALEFHDASSALWSAPYTNYLVHRSEDDIQDVSQWIVSQGKDLYAMVCAHPEAIAAYESMAHANPHTLAFVADSILDEQFGDDWNLDDDYQDFADSGYATISDYWEAR